MEICFGICVSISTKIYMKIDILLYGLQEKTKAKNMFTYGQPQIDLPDLQMTVLELWIGCWWFPNLGKKMRIHCQGTYSEKEVIMQYQIPHIYKYTTT